MKIRNKIEVAQAVEQGWIPQFLFQIWNEKHGGDPVTDYKKECRWTPTDLCFLGTLICFVGGAIFMIRLDKNESSTVVSVVSIVGGILLGIGLLGIIAAFFRPEPDNKNGHQCYAAIARLFSRFNIDASAELAKISKEEFRANIEKTLCGTAAMVAIIKDGFEGIERKQEFNKKHAAALEWSLCHESHGKYFPQKQKEPAMK